MYSQGSPCCVLVDKLSMKEASLRLSWFFQVISHFVNVPNSGLIIGCTFTEVQSCRNTRITLKMHYAWMSFVHCPCSLSGDVLVNILPTWLLVVCTGEGSVFSVTVTQRLAQKYENFVQKLQNIEQGMYVRIVKRQGPNFWVLKLYSVYCKAGPYF